jgi:2,4-dienoyl-CoA reductase-like NADH-dependent reductase (Old Yellow Enzyme family)
MDMLSKGDEMIQGGVCDFAGYGRIILAYPQFYRDWLSGNLQAKKLCALCSNCTVLMRNKCIAGCAIHDEIYKELLKGLKK